MELEKHRARATERGRDDDGQNYVPDFVDVISTAPLVDGKPVADRLQATVLVELLIAGTETASTTVEWAMAELVANPNVMKRAREELDAVVGRGRLMQESVSASDSQRNVSVASTDAAVASSGNDAGSASLGIQHPSRNKSDLQPACYPSRPGCL